jgi:hypothetical protein
MQNNRYSKFFQASREVCGVNARVASEGGDGSVVNNNNQCQCKSCVKQRGRNGSGCHNDDDGHDEKNCKVKLCTLQAEILDVQDTVDGIKLTDLNIQTTVNTINSTTIPNAVTAINTNVTNSSNTINNNIANSTNTISNNITNATNSINSGISTVQNTVNGIQGQITSEQGAISGVSGQITVLQSTANGIVT